MFVDRVTLHLSAGKGGNGAVAWRREKFIPKGGPAGGNGGNGGSIYFESSTDVPSLESFRNQRIIKARDGAMGGGNNCTGKKGPDLLMKVPLGTLVKDVATQEVLFDFTHAGENWKVCQGGRGGKGNSRFKSPTNQAPLLFTEGTPGEVREVELELKLIADVGLVGMPNAGKSTLLSHLAHIAVKIAPYPFTTLQPNLGYVTFSGGSRILLADIPGIIERAHEDRGLGLAFLRHIERCPILLFLIELSPWEDARDPYEEWLMLCNELKQHNPELLEKPFLVVLNKIDQENTAPLAEQFRKKYPHAKETLFVISAQEGIGCEELKEAIYQLGFVKQ